PPTAPGAVEVLYLGEGRPALLRFHLVVDGKPYTARWEAALGKMFDLLDRDKDGVLDREEAGRTLPAPQVQQMMAGNPQLAVAPSRGAPPLGGMDADGDGKITRAEFLAYYRAPNAAPAVRATRLKR